MSLVPFLAAALVTFQPDISLPSTAAGQQPSAAESIQDEPVDLGEILVEGRSLENLVRNFVSEVAAPNEGRGLARWDRRLCVGVVNLRRDTAEYIADRISTVAEDLGIEAGNPGCQPNVLVVATDDPKTLARTLVEQRPRAFRRGGSGMDQGRSALREFIEADKPVRWWQVSAPIEAETGGLAVSIPGIEAPPRIRIRGGSRLRSQMVDYFIKNLIIVDMNRVSQLSIPQLADYLAMISMAQIDPDADTSVYLSILNVLNDPQRYLSLTEWDQAYLSGVYAADQTLLNRRASRTAVSRSIIRAHRNLHETTE